MINTINDRKYKIIQYSTKENWTNELPNDNWLCVIVSNKTERKYLDELNGKIILRNVCYVCLFGEQCEEVHDILDENIGIREVETENNYLPSHIIITTWHYDFEEGFWFAFNAAFHEEKEIDEVIIIDMTNGKEISRIKETVEKIKRNE